MTTIGELVSRFAANPNYTDEDHAIAQEWARATRCSKIDVRVMAEPKESLTEGDKTRREEIREGTRAFARGFFDDRPDVVRSLDSLIAELGVKDEAERRKEFLPFKRLYTRDETMVLLLKHLQPASGRERYTRERIAEYFLTSERTINDYIGELLPAMDSRRSARVFGQIVQMDPARSTNIPESTTHPLFLPLNMVELYTLVDMLVRHVDDQVEGRIVGSVLKRVLDQTTSYAYERLTHIEGLDGALHSIEHFERKRGNAEAVMFREKEAIQATVRYLDDGAEKRCTGYISRNHADRSVIDISGTEQVFHIPFKDIVELSTPRE